MKFAHKTKIFAVILLILTVLPAIFFNTSNDNVPTAASKVLFARAHAVEIIEEEISPDTWTEGRRIGVQLVSFEIDGGEHDGTVLMAVNNVVAYSNIDIKLDTNVILRLDYDENNELYIVAVDSYNRMFVLGGLLLVFSALLIFFGGKKGISALVGLFYTGFCLWFIFIPMILRGHSPILSAVFLVALASSGTLVFLNGFSKKTACAIIGCVGGVAIAGISAMIVGDLTPINGFNMPEAEELVLRSSDNGLQISGLLVSGILVASLGAVMDVSMTITSAIFEIHEKSPNISQKELAKSGMNIGRDAMGTMANTLILAFAGASLNTLILFQVFDYPSLQLLNSDLIAIEVIQGLCGSIGIVLTVPLVAFLGSRMVKSK